MPKPIQLRISSPCHEDWSKMAPNESGRHCASCQKTVVDFTGMSDAEIVRYISGAGSNVCGRLLPGQMDRKLASVSPVQRNGGKGWQLLLAGAMLTADGSLPRQPAVMGEMHMPAPPPPPPKVDSMENDILVTLSAIKLDTVLEAMPDVLMGDMSLEPVDTVPEVKFPGGDSIISQIGDRHPCTPSDTLPEVVYAGGISVRQVTFVDTVKQFVKDTLTTLRILPKEVLRVYPNPISRGSAFHLAWQSEPGTYQVRLVSVSGALIQSRVVQVGSPSQVDTWEMPGGLGAGVYIIQVIRPGQAGGFTQKVVVE